MPNEKIETRAIKWAITSAIFWTLAKFTVWLGLGSMSMITSAIDSLWDIFVSALNLFIVKTSNKEADDDHNYGHSKVEWFWAIFEGWFILWAGVFVIYQSIHNLIIHVEIQSSYLWIATMVAVTIMTLFIVKYLQKAAERTWSLVLKSDALHYKTDIYMNLWVLLSLILIKLTWFWQIDSIVSILIAGYMIYSSSHIIIEGFDLLMDKALSKEEIDNIQKILETSKCSNIKSFHDLKTKKGKIKQVEAHMVVEWDMKVKNLHDSMLNLSEKIKKELGQETKVYLHPDYLEEWEPHQW
ncbi:MAG: cation efflux family protein [uncultured bacterium (gcode 4)]|uniref:Cation efflux family protein n=1 Tax=uncultured bacterium (gcode 4) TaxID=1234023 RepID=K2GWG3_9BACT|nr:MAG: cation efflux family protein [uncultured bacterium (gcode 4)]